MSANWKFLYKSESYAAKCIVYSKSKSNYSEIVVSLKFINYSSSSLLLPTSLSFPLLLLTQGLHQLILPRDSTHCSVGCF